MVLRLGVSLAFALLLWPQTVIAAPGTPIGLTSTVVNQAGGGIVTLTWNLAGGEATSTIVVEAGSGPGTSNVGTFDVSPTSPLMVTAPAGTYYVRIRARNASGLSGPSNEVVIVVGGGTTPCTPPSAPSNLNFTVAGTTVILTWTPGAGALSYVVSAGSFAGGSDIIVFDTGTPANTLTANAANGVFYVRVAARNACGTSSASNEVVITVGGPPTANLQITLSPNPVPFSGVTGTGPFCAGATNTWFFTATFTETAGVGVTLTTVSNVIDGVVQADVANNIVVPANGTTSFNRQFCNVSSGQHTVVSTYRGTDANGRAVSFLAPTTILLARP